MTPLHRWLGRKVALASALAVLALMVLIVYQVQLVETNVYAGFVPLNVDLGYLSALTVALLLVGIMMPIGMSKPSDFFRAIYGVFVMLPFVTLYPLDGRIGLLSFIACFALLILPLLVITVTSRVRFTLIPLGVLGRREMEFVALGMCVLGSAIAYAYAPGSAGLDLSLVYERRYEAREVFISGSPLAYIFSMSVNGFVPFLAFAAGVEQRRWLLVVSLACAVAFFYVAGLKAQFGYLFLAYFLGVGVRRDVKHALYSVTFLMFLFMFVVAALEYALNDQSFVVELVFRRVFAVPAHVMSSYFDMMFGDASLSWSPWTGVNAPEGVTFLIGERYFGNAETNANTNAFLYSLASAGIPAYSSTLVLVVGVMLTLDALHRFNQSPIPMYLGFGFSMLLVEQAATTALLTSGFGLLILLAVLGHRTKRAIAQVMR